MNHVMVSGNLTREPEMRSTKSGTVIMNFGIAVNDRRHNGQTGEWEDVAHFLDCVMFGKRAESLSKILHKGLKVYIDGKLSYSSWEAKDGSKRSKIEIVVNDLELPPRSQQNGSQSHQYQQPNNYPQQRQYGPQNGSQQPTGAYQQQGYQQPMQQQGYQQPAQQDMAYSDIPF